MNNMLLFLIINMATLISLNANPKYYFIETSDNFDENSKRTNAVKNGNIGKKGERRSGNYKIEENDLSLDCMEVDTDYFSNDIVSIDQAPRVRNWQECSETCRDKYAKCKFWTFVVGKCLVKTSKDGKRNKQGAISGSRECGSNTEESGSSFCIENGHKIENGKNCLADGFQCIDNKCENVNGDCVQDDECTGHFWCRNNKCRFLNPGGRPFIVQGRSRTTSSQTDRSSNLKNADSWKMGEAPLVQASNPYNQEIGRHWLKQAEAEHASVASFARHTLQLMSIGAPSAVLVSSQEASLDEIKHAKMCYGFASAFKGSDLGPGSLDVNGGLENMDLKDIIRSLILEGCIGETLSAIEVHMAAHNAEDTAIKAAISEIASDEIKHAQLAWDTIKWIIEKYPDSRTFADDIFHAELERHKTPAINDSSLLPATLCKDLEKDRSFRRYGLLVPGNRDKVREAGIQDIIEPTYLAGFKSVNMVSKQIIELDMATLAHEAGLQDIIEPAYHAKFNDVDMISKQITKLDAVTL